MIKKIIVRRKYKSVRFPGDVYDELVKSKERMDKQATKLNGRPTRIPLTRVLRIKVKNPVTLPDEIIKKIARKKKHDF